MKKNSPHLAIAILDTGVAPVADLSSRIITSVDFINKKKHFYDDNGHGTHVPWPQP